MAYKMTYKNKSKTVKNLYLNGLEAVVPSSLTQTKLFQVIGAGAKEIRLQTVKFHGFRTKDELHIYNGYNLDIRFDYPILHYLLMQQQKQNSNNVIIDLNVMLKAIGKQVRQSNRIELIERIKQFRKCDIEVYKVNKSASVEEQKALPTVITSLILEVRQATAEMEFDSFKYEVMFPKDLKKLVNDFDTQKIDLSDFLKIKSRAGKAIYLQLKSHAFIQAQTIKIGLEKFKVHFDEKRSNKQIAQDLKKGFQELEELNLIENWEATKTREEGKKTYKIKKIKVNK